MQEWYAYVNKVYLDLTSKIEKEQQRIDDIVKITYGNKILDMQSKLDSSVAALNNRLLIVEEEINKIQESVVTVRKSVSSVTTSNSDIAALRLDLDDSKFKTDVMKEEMKTTLDLANSQYVEFVDFQKLFDTNIYPILDRINEDIINGDKMELIIDKSNQSNSIVIDSVLDQISVNLELSNQQHTEFLEFKNECTTKLSALSMIEADKHPGSYICSQNYVPVSEENCSRSNDETVSRDVDNSPSFHRIRTNNNQLSSPDVIDCEVLFLTDSNLHKMKEDIMNHGTKATKFFCPLWKDVEYIVNECGVARKPKQIYIQTCTNDIDRSEFHVNDVSNRITEVLVSLKDLIDEEGEIYVSSIFPRTDKMDQVDAMNKALKLVVKNFSYVKFVEHKNIFSTMLRDRKHLDIHGFRTLLANIRFALFGKLPRSMQSKPSYPSDPRHFRNQEGDQRDY